MSRQKVADFTPAMNRAAIPKQIDRAAQVAQEVMEEGLDIEAGDIAARTSQVKRHSPAFRRHCHALQTDKRSWRYR